MRSERLTQLPRAKAQGSTVSAGGKAVWLPDLHATATYSVHGVHGRNQRPADVKEACGNRPFYCNKTRLPFFVTESSESNLLYNETLACLANAFATRLVSGGASGFYFPFYALRWLAGRIF